MFGFGEVGLDRKSLAALSAGEGVVEGVVEGVLNVVGEARPV